MTLPPLVSDWPEPWLSDYRERAAIKEHAAGHPRERAERLAEQECRRRAECTELAAEPRGAPQAPEQAALFGGAQQEPAAELQGRDAETAAGQLAARVLG